MPDLNLGDAANDGNEMSDGCISLDPVLFATHRLGFIPDHHQSAILASSSKQGILNCSRQWGKSTVTAARAVYTARTPKNLAPVLSSSARLIAPASP